MASTQPQADPEAEPPNEHTDWTKVQPNKVNWVKGRGQVVEWKESDVTIIQKDVEGREKRKGFARNGSWKLNEGESLYITGGQVIEW